MVFSFARVLLGRIVSGAKNGRATRTHRVENTKKGGRRG